jgi:hypothetical protein
MLYQNSSYETLTRLLTTNYISDINVSLPSQYSCGDTENHEEHHGADASVEVRTEIMKLCSIQSTE